MNPGVILALNVLHDVCMWAAPIVLVWVMIKAGRKL